jgi:hypothetical protein
MRAYKGKPARNLDHVVNLVGTEDGGYVSVTVPLRAETVAKIEELRDSCAPATMTREAMLRVLIETGLIHWTIGAVKDEVR